MPGRDHEAHASRADDAFDTVFASEDLTWGDKRFSHYYSE